MVEQLKDVRWFRSQPTQMQSSRIDHEKGMMYDVVMVQEGPAKGHGVHLDAEFIEAITTYDNKHFRKTGLKARFGHPSASSETMGTQLGVFSNFRTRKTKDGLEEIADLQLLDAAENSPTHPGMRSWVLQMAEQSPDFIMSSIVFKGSSYFQRDKDSGKKIIMKFDEWGDAINYDPENGNIFVGFEENKGAAHYYTDLVEQGAATDNLFSHQINTHLLAVEAENLLNEHPHLVDFLKQNPDAVGRWLARAGYTITTNTPAKKTMSNFSIRAWLFGESTGATPTAEDLAELRTALEDARTEIQSLRAERDDWRTKYEAAAAQATQLAADAAALRTQVEQLSASVADLTKRLSTVEQQPAAEPTAADTPPAAATTSRYSAAKIDLPERKLMPGVDRYQQQA